MKLAPAMSMLSPVLQHNTQTQCWVPLCTDVYTPILNQTCHTGSSRNRKEDDEQMLAIITTAAKVLKLANALDSFP